MPPPASPSSCCGAKRRHWPRPRASPVGSCPSPIRIRRRRPWRWHCERAPASEPMWQRSRSRAAAEGGAPVIPIVTPEEMKAVDEAAPEPTEVLVHRAGGFVARTALDMLGGSYGRRVVVVAGKGNNGADGRDAATRLRRRGVRVDVVEAADAPAQLPDSDLVIDAAYGTGFHGDYQAPSPGGP